MRYAGRKKYKKRYKILDKKFGGGVLFLTVNDCTVEGRALR